MSNYYSNRAYMETPEDKQKRFKIRRFLVVGLLSLLTVVMTCWAVLAIYYSNLPTNFLRAAVSIFFPFAVIIVFLRVKSIEKAFVFFFILFGILLLWWLLIPPSNHRQWQPMSEKLCSADIDGDEITIHNIRNFEYRSTTDFTARYYDKTFSLSKLETVDLYLNFWGPTLVAHTMMSFGFGDQGYVCVSIETRKEVGEAYSAVKGFFKQYELIYVVGDERDLVSWRTHVKSEEVYLYRLKAKPEVIRSVFLDYFEQINRLNEKPEWYNALTHNCTTTIRGHALPHTENRPLDWRLIVNGFLDEMLYERGEIDTTLPFPELKRKSRINEKATLLNEQFSDRIRRDLPAMVQDEQ